MIRVLIIDDSAFMRKALSIMLESDPDIKVIGTARDGAEGFDLVKKLKPDVVTLDIEMPRTNGLQCLEMIMKEAPTPVLVVSSITTQGAEVTLEALNKGAVDFIAKTQSFVAIDITKIKVDLIIKVKAVAKRRHRFAPRGSLVSSSRPGQTSKSEIAPPPLEVYSLKSARINCIAIGVSTGGPPIVQAILSALPADYPVPLLIAQHMPKEFTGSFASRLNNLSNIHVKEAETGDPVTRGNAYIGRGGMHLTVNRTGIRVNVHLTEDPKEHLYHPSADVLFESTSRVYGGPVLGVILTGMGKDGVVGLRDLKAKGGRILAQNEESCVVYGMPKAAVDEGLADATLNIESIIASLLTL